MVVFYNTLLLWYEDTLFGWTNCYFVSDNFWVISFRVGGTSSVDDFTVGAEACLPIINAILAEVKNKTYPQKCFLNVDLPTNVANHKVNIRLAYGCHCFLASTE